MPRKDEPGISRWRDQFSIPFPQKIEIQEIWLRDHKRDLHLIEKDIRCCTDGSFQHEYVSPIAKNKLPMVLDEWLRREIPETPIGVVQPHVRHEPIEGGWLMPYIDLSSEGVAHYIAEWENIDQRAHTTGFRRQTVDYGKWRARLSRYNVHDTPRTSPADLWWCDTPIGLLWCRLDYEKEFPDGFAFNNHLDLWLRTQEQYPQLENLDLDDVVVGNLMPNRDKEDGWFVQVRMSLNRERDLREIYIGDYTKGPIEPAASTVRQNQICMFLGVGLEPVKFR